MTKIGTVAKIEDVTNVFQCHSCGGRTTAIPTLALESQVGSDCTPVMGDVRVGVCESCGLLQKEISPSWKTLCDQIYGNYQIYHQAAGQEQKVFGGEGQGLKPRSDMIAGLLSDTYELPQSGSVLDIGSGNGAFLRAMNKAFPDWSVTGTDLNDKFRNEIQSISPRATFRSSEELAASDDVYDIISLIHCIEHIPAPAEYLSKVKRHIKASGVLLIEVPDAELNPFDLVVADHSSHFSKATLAAVVRAAGYEVLACGNLVVGKEITLLARPLHDMPTALREKASPRAAAVAKRNLTWLDKVLNCGQRLVSESHPLGVFGTSIAGVWIGSAIGKSLDFYVDEDEVRVGRSYFGIPIIAPSSIPAGATVFVCLEPTLAAAIAARHSGPDRHFVVPPPVATQI